MRHAVFCIASKLYPTFLKRLTIRLKRSEKFGFFSKLFIIISNGFLKFIYQISLEFRIRSILLQMFLQTEMIFVNQSIVSMVKFEKCFGDFIIPIALLDEIGSLEFVTTTEATIM